jgi:hypothetical protein
MDGVQMADGHELVANKERARYKFGEIFVGHIL